MNPGLAALAVAVVAGGVIAVSAREARVAVTGLTVCGVTVPLIGDPFPDPLQLAARLVASILAGYLLWVAVRHEPATRGSRLGWPVEALGAAAAGVAGYAAAGFAGPASGPPEALAAAFALGFLAIGPLLVGIDSFRLAVGLMLVVLAGSVARVALAGSPPPLEQLVLAGLTVAVAGAAGTLAATAIRRGVDLAAATSDDDVPLELSSAATAAGAPDERDDEDRRAAAVAASTPAAADHTVAVDGDAGSRGSTRLRVNPLGARSAGARRLLGRR